MKILKFSRLQHESIPGQRALLTVKFLDDDGEYYSWAPRWTDIEKTFLKAINTEAFNKPESEWLNSFANTVKDVAEGVIQPIQDASKESGQFAELRDGKLRLVQYGFNGQENDVHLTPGFAVTYEFLGDWLGKNVEALVINGIVVHLRDTNSKTRQLVQYPPEELPF